jgi:Cu+-exporting ATPase
LRAKRQGADGDEENIIDSRLNRLPMNNSTSISDSRRNETPAECSLCGLSRGQSRLQLEVGGKILYFCCPGCQHVFQILFNGTGTIASEFRSSALYKDCVAAGIIPASEPTGPIDVVRLSASENKSPAMDEELWLETTLKIEGMECVSCSWLIEEVLRRTAGVVAAEVIFPADMVKVTYQPHHLDVQEIGARISQFGYRACPADEPVDANQKKSFLRLGIASILTFHVMMISFAFYGGFFQDLGGTGINTLSLPLCLLATPVVFYSGWPILVRGWYGLRTWRFTMDTLIALGALTAYGYSLYQMTADSLHLYFDTAAMLITLVLLGRFIENRARRRVTVGLTALHDLVGGKVRMDRQGREQWIKTAVVRPGDPFIVRAGERVPVDGRVVAGGGDVDEAVLTGESRPVRKQTDDEVLAGSLLLAGDLHLSATRVGPESSVGQILELVRKALVKKNPVEQLADRITGLFVPVVLLLAAASTITLLAVGVASDLAVLRAVTILVIACPCALGIATPFAKVAIIARGRDQGIIISEATAFEGAHRLNTIVFDKTGTITQGNFTLLSLFAPDYSEAEVLRRMAAVESAAEHFLAREIRREVRARSLEIIPAADGRIFPGQGVTGRIDDEEVTIGSRQFMREQGLTVPENIAARADNEEKKGLTVIFAAWQNRVRAIAAFGDTVKPEAQELVTGLRRKGIDVWLISGDSQTTTAAIAKQLGIRRFAGRARPEDKEDLVSKLQARGLRVGMVGDGINDAAALARAEVGFSMGSNPGKLMEEAADVLLLGRDINRLPAALNLSALLVKTVRQNLIFAFLYNGIGIPLAMLGLLNPLLAVTAMLASSMTVIGNAMRIAGKDAWISGSTAGSRTVDNDMSATAEALLEPDLSKNL